MPLIDLHLYNATLHETGQSVPCEDSEEDLWFATDKASIEEAKARCRRCPSQVRCLTDAVARREPYGVWGGELLVLGTVGTYEAMKAVSRGRRRPRDQNLAH